MQPTFRDSVLTIIGVSGTDGRMAPSPMVAKKDLATGLWRSGGFVIHLDPRGDDVAIPFRFKHLNILSLPIGLRRDLPANDLRMDDQGIAVTLHFRRMQWDCRIPWRAIFAIGGADGEGSVWPRDIPDESAPGEGLSLSPIPIPEPLKTSLIINGRVIAGDGCSIFAINGEEVPGVKWIDYTHSSVQLGGDIGQIKQHLTTKLPSSGTKRVPSFVMALGYTSGEQNCRVDWAYCRVREAADGLIEIRAGEAYELRVGPGAGPLPYIREWFTRLKRFLQRR